MKNNSTSFASIEITEKVKESIDSGKFGCDIFIDLKKAFDTVNHQIILNKLEHYRVRGVRLDRFTSYLTGRKQYVFYIYNGDSSELKLITCGVPQGSVLGPLQFIIYINDLPNISNKLNIFLFADDTNIYFECNDLFIVKKTANEELKNLNLWLNVNHQSLNIDKTNFVTFHLNNKPLKHHITFNLT